MALSRGGDQAVIKTRYNFDFFGGLSKELEKRTKVKSRVVANALVQLIRDSSSVMIMGHKMSDMDAFGAAVGMACAVRHRDKPVHIVINQERNMAHDLINKITAVPEYQDILISPDDAMVRCDFNTLLIVVDTNRPDYVESQPLLSPSTRLPSSTIIVVRQTTSRILRSICMSLTHLRPVNWSVRCYSTWCPPVRS